MDRRNWEDFGNTIKDVVEDAITHQDFTKLNQTVNNVINDATEGIRSGFSDIGKGKGNPNKDRYKNGRYRSDRYRSGEYRKDAYRKDDFSDTTVKKELSQSLYTPVSKLKGSGLAMAIVGFILGGIFGVLLFVFLLALLTGMVTGSAFWIVIYAILPFFIGTMILGASGRGLLVRSKRYGQYLNGLGEKTYCNIAQLAEQTGNSPAYIKRDLRKMIQKGWFREGHLDDENTCLITDNATFEEYRQIKRQKDMIGKEKKAPREEPKKQAPLTEAEAVIREGEDYIRKIRESNDAIHGREISEKISRMELLVRRIFERIQEHPEQVDDIQKLMNYYLPTTVKLLNAYEELDIQPVQGANILNSKKEIEGTLDTLNYAFEKLLDNLFQDTAWDVSSDISVLHTILSQEGLTKNDFQRKDTK